MAAEKEEMAGIYTDSETKWNPGVVIGGKESGGRIGGKTEQRNQEGTGR